jgi:hypothetical protein
MRRSALVILILLAGCAGDTTLTLDTTDLPATGPGVYALWLDDGQGGVELAGTFADNDGGSFVIAEIDYWAEVFVTVERSVPDVPGAEILRGPVEDGGVELALSLEIEVAGGVSLWTPTDNAVDADNNTEGVWFIERVNDQSEPALTMRSPAPGWAFAGWTRTQGWYLPMGSFTVADENDSACFYCGADDDVGLPGEDFVADLPPEIPNTVDLADGDSGIVLSISPGAYDISPGAYDISPGAYDIEAQEPFRFALDVLSVEVPAGQEGGVLMDFSSILVPPSASLTGP